MKKNILIIFILSTLLISVFTHIAYAQGNPFTSPDVDSAETAKHGNPSILNKIFLKIILWQQYLKTKMSFLVRQAKATHSMKPIWLLIFTAFIYGVIHAAGPGHGKALALSYALTQDPSYCRGLIFGNFIALFHGLSGIVFVIFIKLIINTSVMDNLNQVTRITQIVSYSIIALAGTLIFLYNIYKIVKSNTQNPEKNHTKLNPILAAAAIGCIPCPGVILVMIFALSMNLLMLSIILGLAISLGMAFTISIVVILAISGKFVSLAAIEKKNKSIQFETWIELFAGAGLMILGLLFLGANI